MLKDTLSHPLYPIAVMIVFLGFLIAGYLWYISKKKSAAPKAILRVVGVGVVVLGCLASYLVGILISWD